jgi:hypothetical protein
MDLVARGDMVDRMDNVGQRGQKCCAMSMLSTMSRRSTLFIRHPHK